MGELRVLIVDDEGDLVSAMAERLALRGFQIDVATNGDDALRLVREEPLDAAVVDVKMPGLGGLGLLAAIKRAKADLPVILFTGHSSVADAELGMRAGAFDYIIKPVDIDTLAEKLRQATAVNES